MPTYVVVGKLGTGKTKFTIWMAQQALRDGLRVASNVDMVLEKITPERRSSFIRIPDKPTESDLDSCGHGNPESYDEDRNGVMILDELGTWLNARSFSDKSRAGVIDWLIHARKMGWTVYLIVQDANMIDKQVREALVEYTVNCMRMDKVRIPIIGKMLGIIGRAFGWKRLGYLPRFHLATARVGVGVNAIVAERWTYRGDDLHAAYDTRQRFTASYPHGTHTALAPWGYAPPLKFWEGLVARYKEWSAAGEAARGVRSAPALSPKLPIIDTITRTLPPDERMRHASRLARAGLI